MVGLLKQFTKRLISVNTCKYCSIYSKNFYETIELSNGRKLKFQVPQKIASGGDGVAEASINDTAVFVSAVGKPKAVTEGFLPLTVDFFLSSNPSGNVIPGYQIKRHHIMTKEILTSRIIDRSIRPLFDTGLECEIQIACKVRASDVEHDPDVIAINAASACLATSSLPWGGPIGAVRMGHANGEFITLPTQSELKNSDLNLLVVAGQQDGIVMLEGSGKPVKKKVLQNAISIGIKECQPIITAINKLVNKVNLPKKNIEFRTIHSEFMETIRTMADARIRDVFTTYTYDKHERDNKINAIQEDVGIKVAKHFNYSHSNLFNEGFKMVTKEVFRDVILSGDPRVDGRKPDDLRPIYCDSNVYDALHGSSKFIRGQTIVECSLQIDSQDRFQNIDPGTGLPDNFHLKYEFPSYSTGEISFKKGGTSRREIGHGALAKKALSPIIPTEIPYSIHLLADVYASNGSSSMGTVCAGTMALMDAGVDIKFPVSGVAVGVITQSNENGDVEKYNLLTDLLGIEDYFGDMDFKIASCAEGITALQADIKLKYMPLPIILEAIEKGVVANKNILQIMKKTISKPNSDKKNLPVTKFLEATGGQRIQVLKDAARHLKKVELETCTHVIWMDESSQFKIFAPNQKLMDEAEKGIKKIMEDSFNEPPIGQICTSVIREIRDFGVMVELVPGMKPLLLGIEHLDIKRVRHPSDLNLKVGDKLKVQYFGRDPVSGRMRLSRKSLLAPGSAIIAKKFPS